MTTKANAISNRLRQIRDRSRPTTKARSAGHEAATTSRPHSPISRSSSSAPPDPFVPVVPRGHAKADALARARQLPAHSPAHLSDSSHHDAIQAICTRATSGPARA